MEIKTIINIKNWEEMELKWCLKSVKSPQFMLVNSDEKNIKSSSKNENDFTNSVATKNLSCKVKPNVHTNVS